MIRYHCDCVNFVVCVVCLLFLRSDFFARIVLCQVIMEFMTGGTLTELVKNETMMESHIAYVCREVVHGLAHLHARNRLHRDIKSDNILLSSKGVSACLCERVGGCQCADGCFVPMVFVHNVLIVISCLCLVYVESYGKCR